MIGWRSEQAGNLHGLEEFLDVVTGTHEVVHFQKLIESEGLRLDLVALLDTQKPTKEINDVATSAAAHSGRGSKDPVTFSQGSSHSASDWDTTFSVLPAAKVLRMVLTATLLSFEHSNLILIHLSEDSNTIHQSAARFIHIIPMGNLDKSTNPAAWNQRDRQPNPNPLPNPPLNQHRIDKRGGTRRLIKLRAISVDSGGSHTRPPGENGQIKPAA